MEKLSGGGTSSGLMSFLEVLDKGAGATKSGGTTRRARQDGRARRRPSRDPGLRALEGPRGEEGRGTGRRPATRPTSTARPTAPCRARTRTTPCALNDRFMDAVVHDGTLADDDADDGRGVRDAARASCGTRSPRPRGSAPTPVFSSTTRFRSGTRRRRRIASTRRTRASPGTRWSRRPRAGSGSTLLVGKSADVIGGGRSTPLGDAHRLHGSQARLPAAHPHRVRGADHGRPLRCGRSSVGTCPSSSSRSGEHVCLQGSGFGRRSLGERLALAIGVAVGDGCPARAHHGARVQELVVLTMADEEAGVLATIAGEVNEQKRNVGAPRECRAIRGQSTSRRRAQAPAAVSRSAPKSSWICSRSSRCSTRKRLQALHARRVRPRPAVARGTPARTLHGRRYGRQLQ